MAFLVAAHHNNSIIFSCAAALSERRVFFLFHFDGQYFVCTIQFSTYKVYSVYDFGHD